MQFQWTQRSYLSIRPIIPIIPIILIISIIFFSNITIIIGIIFINSIVLVIPINPSVPAFTAFLVVPLLTRILNIPIVPITFYKKVIWLFFFYCWRKCKSQQIIWDISDYWSFLKSKHIADPFWKSLSTLHSNLKWQSFPATQWSKYSHPGDALFHRRCLMRQSKIQSRWKARNWIDVTLLTWYRRHIAAWGICPAPAAALEVEVSMSLYTGTDAHEYFFARKLLYAVVAFELTCTAYAKDPEINNKLATVSALSLITFVVVDQLRHSREI